MDGITPRNGKYRAQVRRKGYPHQSKTFTSFADAVRWKREMERTIDQALFLPEIPVVQSFSVYAQNYREQVVPHLRSHKTENGRLHTLEQYFGAYALNAITGAMMAKYREQRLQTHAPQTVAHELKLLRRVMHRACLDWGARLPGGLPEVRLPKVPRGREHTLSREDEQRLLQVTDDPLHSLIILAVETAARRGELLALRGEDINWVQRTLMVRPGKTDRARIVPLTPRALQCLEQLPRQGLLFAWHRDSVHHAFKRVCIGLGLVDLRFHDLRHTATTRFAELGLTATEIALCTGHMDLSMVMRYTHLDASNLSEKLSRALGSPE